MYANVDELVHSNPYEPFGIAPQEAMAERLPLVVANSGGVKSYMNESNAWMGPAEGTAFAAHATAESFSWESARPTGTCCSMKSYMH